MTRRSQVELPFKEMKTYIYKIKRKDFKRRKERKGNQDSPQRQEPSSQKAADFRISQNTAIPKEASGEVIKT